ncbi:MAG TPA: ThiF family adenylyltransferase [Streptosporangiaceae bacterium]|jgi:molybdopterin/thiamine biosynthesis adenylyltransferase
MSSSSAFTIHPAYLLYLDEVRAQVRLGSMPGDAQLDDVETAVLSLIKTCATGPATVHELTRAINARGSSVTPAMVADAVDTLLTEEILVRADDAALMANDDDGMSRQRLFLSLLSPMPSVLPGQQAIEKATATVIGVGAIGSVVLTLLARAGMRRFNLIDGDRVEQSNLHRQILFGYSDIGRSKVAAAADALRRVCPDCDIREDCRTISSSEQAEELMPDSGIVICSADTPRREIRRWVNQGAVRRGVPVAFGGLLETACVIGPLVVPNVTACWACALEAMGDQPAAVPGLMAGAPAWGPLVAIAGGLLAGDVLRLLGGLGEPATLGATVLFDPTRQILARTPWSPSRECPVCASPAGVLADATAAR